MTKASGVGERRREDVSSVSARKCRWRFRVKPFGVMARFHAVRFPWRGTAITGRRSQVRCCTQQKRMTGKAARNSFQAVAEVCLETFETLQQKRRR